MIEAPVAHLVDYLLQQQAAQLVVLTDSNVEALYPHRLEELNNHFECYKIVVPAGEESKSPEQAQKLWNIFLDYGFDRELTVLNFGGGMICDLGGFVAATYKRGVRCVNYPTTLLAMIDAAYGGKTAINLQGVKNGVGVIRQPDFVVPADIEMLSSLPYVELLSGFGELIKYALLFSADLFKALQALSAPLAPQAIRPEWIETCVRYKAQVVAQDPDDRKERRVLNFGHTVGHALESLYAAIGRPIPHGVAVAMGLVYESQYSVKQGFLSPSDYKDIQHLVRRFYEVPAWSEQLHQQLQPYLIQDKKNNHGEICCVTIQAIGSPMA